MQTQVRIFYLFLLQFKWNFFLLNLREKNIRDLVSLSQVWFKVKENILHLCTTSGRLWLLFAVIIGCEQIKNSQNFFYTFSKKLFLHARRSWKLLKWEENRTERFRCLMSSHTTFTTLIQNVVWDRLILSFF